MSERTIDRARAAMQIRWDPVRERRVLTATLHRCTRRARHRRAALWVTAAAMAFVLFRVLPRLSSPLDQSGGFAGARPGISGTGGNAGTG
jgi:hypothetical protein